VDTTDDILFANEAVCHERAAMQTASEENRDFVVEARHYEIDSDHQGMTRFAIFEFAPNRDLDFVHLL
jgi:hypothetical protein